MTAGPEGPAESDEVRNYPSPPAGVPLPDATADGTHNQSSPAVYDPPLGTIGDITITQSQVITPVGAWPLRGAVWTFTDMSRTEQSMPAYAIVLAIIFFIFCLLGLLFLLMKETRTVGFVQVGVSGPGRYHSTTIPVSSPQQVHNLVQYVNWARSLSASA